MKRKSSKKSYNEESSDAEETQQNGSEEPKGKRGRKSKSAKNEETETSEIEQTNDVSESEDPLATASEEEAEYEVEKILDEKTVKGSKHFLIRWKGYTEEEDTWEPESTLTCDALIQEFKNNKKAGKSSKPNKEKDDKKKKKDKKKVEEKDDEDEDESKDFEVAKIIDVHFCRDGKREFLISWKGYASAENTWEPEENLDCEDLIEKFMQKVGKARMVDTKELRVNRKPTERLNFEMHAGHRKLSKRRNGKQRVTYYDTE